MNRLLAAFWELAGEAVPEVDVVNGEGVLASSLAVGELALGAVAAASSAAAGLASARGSRRPACRVDGAKVRASFQSDRHFRLDGRPAEAFAPLSGFWRTGDGWVRTHANYPHHRARLLAALALPETAGPEALSARLRRSSASEAEGRVLGAGGLCVAVRSVAAWRQHPQAAAIDRLPLVAWQCLGEAPRRRLGAMPSAPLLPAAGLRVLDLTRVIAGPVATRTLALLGAEVLRVDSPRLEEIAWQHLDTGMGKRSTLLDLGEASGRERFEGLLADADVVALGYRPGSLDRLGLAPDDLVRRRPGLVVATLSAWGLEGPFGGQRGFDSIVQAATGIAMVESNDGVTPGKLPAQALDHATGYLLAAAVLRAVALQVRDGASYLVQAHLARTAHWVLAHPCERTDVPRAVNGVLLERRGDAGLLRYPAPAVELDGGPKDWRTVAERWGADAPEWRAERSG
ncbi:MAG: CoA transferase [Actinomycetota bacterium]|nr:CoA transferase [Actinomycetota bacterium]